MRGSIPSDSERGDPGPRLHPERAPWPPPARRRGHIGVPVGHRIRRTQTRDLTSTAPVSPLRHGLRANNATEPAEVNRPAAVMGTRERGRRRPCGVLGGMPPSLPEGKALRCKLVRDVAGSDVEPDLRVVIAILIAQRSVNDRLCSLAGAVLNSSSAWGSSRCSECAVVLMLVLLGSNLSDRKSTRLNSS